MDRWSKFPIQIVASTATEQTSTWQDPRLLWGIAFVAAVMLAGAWLLSRTPRRGKLNRGALVFGGISIFLHILLIALLPYAMRSGGGPVSNATQRQGVTADTTIATLSNIELVDEAAENANDNNIPQVLPLPIASLQKEGELSKAEPVPLSAPPIPLPNELPPPDFSSLPAAMEIPPDSAPAVDQWLSDLLTDISPTAAATDETSAQVKPAEPEFPVPNISDEVTVNDEVASVQSRDVVDGQVNGVDAMQPPTITGTPGRVVGEQMDEFANRRGAAKQFALNQGGGDDRTEAAVAAGLQWLSQFQRPDGAWDPRTSGAGVERSVMGQHRSGAGATATTGISGLALLSMLGAGSTHQAGTHALGVRNGLQYLLNVQSPDGSLAADADPYARTYCHGMATLALCESAAMTGDPIAQEAARAAVGYTLRTQNRTTGGWRYVAGDPGDMSQLGWQAMVLASGRAAGADVPTDALQRVDRFLRSVRAGTSGGLASYKPGEAPSRTMTAEALAVRLMLGQNVPIAEIEEAEKYLLAEPPGVGTDNYYYWYYASLALHQLQRDSWRVWNQKMKDRLLATQLPDGSWSTNTVWGGHGGKVYTTAMACLCLETYYRHLTTDARGNPQTAANSNFLRR